MSANRMRRSRAGLGRRCRIALAGAVFAVLPLVCGLSLVHAGTWSDVKESKTFAICANPDALPFSSEVGHPPGLQIDVAEAVAKRLGVRLEVDWIYLRAKAARAGCDAFMTSVYESGGAAGSEIPERHPLHQTLTRPYARVTTRVVTRDGAPALTSFADLRRTVVAVPPGSYPHYLLDTHHVRVRTRWWTDSEILDAVASGKVPAGVASSWNLGWYRKTHPNSHLRANAGFVFEPDLDYDVAITLLNSDQKLVTAVNQILTALIADGRIAAIFEKYGIPYQPPIAR
jgi:polar amino acid transport system substrate-binding protein